MKMPRRTFFPIYKQPNDIFGLQHVTVLGQAGETDTERRRRIAKVEAGVADAFKAAVHHLGEDEARQLFLRVMRRPKRGPGKTLARDRDHRLLKAYDEAVANGESIASLAKRLHGEGQSLALPKAPSLLKSANCGTNETSARGLLLFNHDGGVWRHAMSRRPYFQNSCARNSPRPFTRSTWA